MTGSVGGSASATAPPGGPGFGRRGSSTPVAGGRRPRHGPRPSPPARSSSHLAGAVSAIYSGLLINIIRKRRRRQERRTLRGGPGGRRAARLAGLGCRRARCQLGCAWRATGLASTYRRSGSPAATISGEKATMRRQAAAARRNCQTTRTCLITPLWMNPAAGIPARAVGRSGRSYDGSRTRLPSSAPLPRLTQLVLRTAVSVSRSPRSRPLRLRPAQNDHSGR